MTRSRTRSARSKRNKLGPLPLTIMEDATVDVLGRNVRNDLKAHLRSHPYFSVPVETNDQIQKLMRRLEQIENRDQPRR